MYYSRQQEGYSIVEVLIAIAILLIAIVGPITIATTGLKNAYSAKERTTAFFLAQESLEWVLKWRNDAGLVYTEIGSGDPWIWAAGIPVGCRDGTTACGIDIHENVLFPCNNPGTGRSCDLYQHTTGRTRLRHQTNGTETEFRRELHFTTGADYVTVQSVVTWGDGADDQVSLEAMLFNIHE